MYTGKALIALCLVLCLAWATTARNPASLWKRALQQDEPAKIPGSDTPGISASCKAAFETAEADASWNTAVSGWAKTLTTEAGTCLISSPKPVCNIHASSTYASACKSRSWTMCSVHSTNKMPALGFDATINTDYCTPTECNNSEDIAAIKGTNPCDPGAECTFKMSCNSGLSTGAVVGIVFGVIIGICVIVGLIVGVIVIRRRMAKYDNA